MYVGMRSLDIYFLCLDTRPYSIGISVVSAACARHTHLLGGCHLPDFVNNPVEIALIQDGCLDKQSVCAGVGATPCFYVVYYGSVYDAVEGSQSGRV